MVGIISLWSYNDAIEELISDGLWVGLFVGDDLDFLLVFVGFIVGAIVVFEVLLPLVGGGTGIRIECNSKFSG